MHVLPLMQAVQNPGPSFVLLPMFLMLIMLIGFAFWLWMLVDALTNQPTTNDKILWFLVIVLLNFLGALIYFFVGKQRAV